MNPSGLYRKKPMDLQHLISELSSIECYPFAVDHVDVRQTHISVVFLAGPFAYKIKKPVDLGFLDFTTLNYRHFYCQEEVRLNRRLAPTVYLGVVPITRRNGKLCLEGDGETEEWAVKMRRLPDQATLRHQLGERHVNANLMNLLGQRIACFHQQAESSSEISSYGTFDTVALNARENFKQTISQLNRSVSRAVYDRLELLTEHALAEQRLLIDSRAGRGMMRDTHGDLRADHIYFFVDKRPVDFVIIDCIEFNKRFRYADPIADMAFLFMDLKALGFPHLAEAFADGYFGAADDNDGRKLLGYYTSYRAIVRAKVEGFKLDEMEIPLEERQRAQARAMKQWSLALGEMETANRKPCLNLIGGLPGTGKSTLARELAKRINAQLIRSDVVRKELAGLKPDESARNSYEQGIYDSTWTEKTYAECLRRAAQYFAEGRRVIIDASFGQERHRRDATTLALNWCVPFTFFLCTANSETIRRRLAQRNNDASDADWHVYEKAANRWEATGTETGRELCEIESENGIDASLQVALNHLRKRGLKN